MWVAEIELAIGFQATGLWLDLEGEGVEEQGRVEGGLLFVESGGLQC